MIKEHKRGNKWLCNANERFGGKMEQFQNGNSVCLEGTVTSELIFSHELYGEKFCLFTLAVPRLSERTDSVQITVSEKHLPPKWPGVGSAMAVCGQLRSYNKLEDGRNKLILTVFARSFSSPSSQTEDPNQIHLEGFICKKPVYRTTPFGREIADLLIAVNRAYKKSDYIPVIAWGRNARYAGELEVGDKVKILGRFQSREYQKGQGTEEKQTCVAYEVSVSRLELAPKAADETVSGQAAVLNLG